MTLHVCVSSDECCVGDNLIDDVAQTWFRICRIALEADRLNTDGQRLVPDNTEFKAVSEALRCRTFGGKNEGLGWHTLHVIFASAFYRPLV